MIIMCRFFLLNKETWYAVADALVHYNKIRLLSFIVITICFKNDKWHAVADALVRNDDRFVHLFVPAPQDTSQGLGIRD